MARLVKILIAAACAAAILFTFVGCTTRQVAYGGAVIPHHLLVDDYIENVYSELADSSIERVVILSPNHFDYGFNYIQSTDKDLNFPLDLQLIAHLQASDFVSVENQHFADEHGVTVHIDYLKKHFPQAKLLPVTFKKGASKQGLDALISELTSLKNTLFIASIDFSHYVSEETALKNDNRIRQRILKNSSWIKSKNLFSEMHDLAKSVELEFEDSVAMDCAECMYVLLDVMRQKAFIQANFLKRTSSASLLNLDDPTQNTSHNFFSFSKSAQN